MPHAPQAPLALPDGRIHLTDARGRIVTLPAAWRLAANSAPSVTPRSESLRQHGALATGPRRVGVRTGGASGVLHSVPASGRDGVWSIAWPPSVAAWGFGPNASQLDALHAIAGSTPVTLQVGSLVAPALTLDALSVTRVEEDGERERVTLTWEAFDPLYAGLTVHTNAGTLALGASRVVTLGGSAASVPVVTLTGTIQDPRVTNEATLDAFEFHGALAPGDVLEVDPDALTARLNGVSVLGLMSDTFALGFALRPGENPIRLDGTSGSANVTLAWRERWY